MKRAVVRMSSRAVADLALAPGGVLIHGGRAGRVMGMRVVDEHVFIELEVEEDSRGPEADPRMSPAGVAPDGGPPPPEDGQRPGGAGGRAAHEPPAGPAGPAALPHRRTALLGVPGDPEDPADG
jgi:hypothetical protein